MITIHYCLHRKPGLSLEEFSAYWNGPHADLVKRVAPAIGVIRYVQHHAIAPEAAVAMQAMRGLQAPFDGVAEIGFESFEALERGNLDPAAAAAQAELAQDEAKFIDLARSAILFTQAKKVIG
ncbi:EthD domain-containing protein [Novosphingobium lentum]|uniref:EthD domain-containing protein n=1 Tax=Novosphingobium lentum TaxID=145287 RepID=UPI00082F1926|nr:EthD domain-containing protein [Novosphingobium lentum]